jgi:hypothetical protein
MVDGQRMADGRCGGCNGKHVVPNGSEKVFATDNLPFVVSGLPDRWRSLLENTLEGLALHQLLVSELGPTAGIQLLVVTLGSERWEIGTTKMRRYLSLK